MENKNYPKWYDLATATIGTVGQYTFIHPIWSSKISAQTPGKEPLKINIKNLPVLYRGFWLHVLRAWPVSATQISVGNFVQEQFPVSIPEVTSFYSGFLGGIVSAPIVTITDTIMTQQKQNAANASSIVKSIYEKRGLSGFFSGLTSTALRNGGRSAAYFSVFPTTYDLCMTHATGYPTLSENEKKVAATLTATSVAGLFATATTNPPDVIKTVQQSTLLDKGEKVALTATQAAKRIYETRGALGFFSGMTHRLASRTVEVFIMGQALQTVPKMLDSVFGDEHKSSTGPSL